MNDEKPVRQGLKEQQQQHKAIRPGGAEQKAVGSQSMQTELQLRKSKGRLSREDQRRLGDILQRVYDDVVQEGVPDRFVRLMEQLNQPTTGNQPATGTGEAISSRTVDGMHGRVWTSGSCDRRQVEGPGLMTMSPSVRDAMLAAVPSLRAFGISLSGNVDRADDLVQETLLRAMANIDSFQPGTNMSAWLFTILRNLFRSEYRKRRREVEDADGKYAETLKSHPEQHGRVEFEEFRVALAKLPPDQREALVLVGASGFSYEEAAAICDCAVGTIKSRVNRARTRLTELLSIDDADEFGPDHTTRAILSAGGHR